MILFNMVSNKININKYHIFLSRLTISPPIFWMISKLIAFDNRYINYEEVRFKIKLKFIMRFI